MDFRSDAEQFWPSPAFAKTAILVEVVDSDVITEIEAPFGRQRMVGSFYIVADGEGSYGAASDLFEASHRRVGESLWVKTAGVLAYQTDAALEVHTTIGDHQEATVVAQPGDWIVRQEGGEIMVVTAEEFGRRYTRDSADD